MVGVINPPSFPFGGTLQEWEEKHYKLNYNPYVERPPYNESCPEGEKGGRLAAGDKYGLCWVDPVHASATATKKRCDGPLATATVLPGESTYREPKR